MKIKNITRLSKIKFLAALIFNLLYIFVLVTNNLGKTPIETPDSALYFEFEFFKSVRMPGIVFPYMLLQNYEAITTFQLIFQCLAMIYFSTVIMITNKNLVLICLKIYVVFITTTNKFTTQWINTVMSESLTISATIFLIGTIILLFHFPRSKNIFIWTIFVILGFSSFKQGSVIIGIIIYLCVIYIFRGIKFKAKSIFIFLTTIILLYFLFLSFSVNNISSYNLVAILGYRVLSNPSWKSWFESQGLPTNFLGTLYEPETNNLNINGALGDSKIFDWISNFGMSTYLEFSLTHPNYLLLAPIYPKLLGNNHGFGSGLIWNNLLLENLVWGAQSRYIIVVLIIIMTLIYIIGNSKWIFKIRQIKADLFMICISIFWAYIVWQLAPGDFTRTQFPSGLMLVISSAFLILDTIFASQNKSAYLKDD